MEREEGWSELEIGKVKPVYIGGKKHVYTVKLGELAEIPGSPYVKGGKPFYQRRRQIFSRTGSLSAIKKF